jgi:hypothetical protein
VLLQGSAGPRPGRRGTPTHLEPLDDGSEPVGLLEHDWLTIAGSKQLGDPLLTVPRDSYLKLAPPAYALRA